MNRFLQIEAIVDTADGLLTSTDALNLTSQLDKKMLKNEAQELLTQFQRDKWLEIVSLDLIPKYHSSVNLPESAPNLSDHFANHGNIST